MCENIYTERVKRVMSAASDKYGRNVIDSPVPSDDMAWRFKHCTFDRYFERAYENPLFWRLDTWVNGVNAHCIFYLDKDDCCEELIETKFKAMEVARAEHTRYLAINN